MRRTHHNRRVGTKQSDDGIANTIAQLICRSTSGVIAASQPIRSEKRHFKKSGLTAPFARQEENNQYYRQGVIFVLCDGAEDFPGALAGRESCYEDF